MSTTPLWIELVTVGAEVKAALRTWSDRAAAATVALILGILIGALGLYIIWTIWMATESSAWFLVSTWTVFTLGVCASFAIRGLVKLLAYLLRRVPEKGE